MTEGIWEHIDLTWQNPTDDDFDRVMIRFTTTHYPLNINDGTKIYEGSGESYKHEGLTEGKKYYYSGFTVDKTGNWSDAAHTSCVLEGGGQQWEDETGPSSVSAFTAVPEHSQIILTWLNPKAANFELVRVRSSATTYPSSPTSSNAVYEGTGERATHSGLTNGKKYYYSIFAKDTAGKWSSARFASAIPAGARKMIQSQMIYGAGCLMRYGLQGNIQWYPSCVGVGKEFSIYGGLRFRSKGCSADWLRFKHEWDITLNATAGYGSNQRHEIGEKTDLKIGFTQEIAGMVEVVVSEIRITITEVRVRYALKYIGGLAQSISFRNKLSLWG